MKLVAPMVTSVGKLHNLSLTVEKGESFKLREVIKNIRVKSSFLDPPVFTNPGANSAKLFLRRP